MSPQSTRGDASGSVPGFTSPKETRLWLPNSPPSRNKIQAIVQEFILSSKGPITYSRSLCRFVRRDEREVLCDAALTPWSIFSASGETRLAASNQPGGFGLTPTVDAESLPMAPLPLGELGEFQVKNTDPDRPLLSIVVPAYNMGQFIGPCLGSMAYPRILETAEILVVDDGSTDNTRDIALDYAKRFGDGIRVISKENAGHGSCINVGISEARGRFFKVVDADDWVSSINLVRLLAVLDERDEDLIVNDYLRINGRMRLPVSFSDRLQQQSYEADDFFSMLSVFKDSRCYAPIHAITYRTNTLRKSGTLLRENSPYVDQQYITQPLKEVSGVFYQRNSVYVYRLGRPGQTVSAGFSEKNLEANLSIAIDLFTELEIPDVGKKLRQYILGILFHQSLFIIKNSRQGLPSELDALWRTHDPGRLALLERIAGRKNLV